MITWNPELEQLLKAEGEKALGSAWIHGRCETFYSQRHQWITIPCVILSTVAGSASVGSQAIFSDAKSASLSIGVVSIFVGILQTLAGFWSFAKLQEANRIAEISYSKLHRFIAVELSLPRGERVAPRDFLKFVRDTIERLAETCPLVPDGIILEFHERFDRSYVNVEDPVAIPDKANGLRHITVNAPATPATPPAAQTQTTIRIVN